MCTFERVPIRIFIIEFSLRTILFHKFGLLNLTIFCVRWFCTSFLWSDHFFHDWIESKSRTKIKLWLHCRNNVCICLTVVNIQHVLNVFMKNICSAPFRTVESYWSHSESSKTLHSLFHNLMIGESINAMKCLRFNTRKAILIRLIWRKFYSIDKVFIVKIITFNVNTSIRRLCCSALTTTLPYIAVK